MNRQTLRAGSLLRTGGEVVCWGWLFFFLCHREAKAEPVTFNRHIAPIVYENCSPCHRPNEAAPFPLLSYEEVKHKAKTIDRVVTAQRMPPWKAEPASYPYRDERRLTGEQIALIHTWVELGMPEGIPAERREPPQFASGWQLGEPSLVVKMPSAFHVPEEGPDIYRNFALPLGLTEDRWVTAIDMKPSARGVVHHVLYFADTSGKSHERSGPGPEPGFPGMRPGGAVHPLGGWAVGGQPHFFPEGLALRVPKGSDLVFQVHFHPTGKVEVEQSVIGLYFADKPPTRSLVRIQLPPHYSLFSGLDIPAGERDFTILDSYVLPAPVDAVGVSAHAHYLGKQMKMTATFPDGVTKTLLLIKDWDFSWQDRYFFKDLVPLPKGTKLSSEIHWDNSADNPRNPSHPPVRVAWGEESKDEMGSVSLLVVPQIKSDLGDLRQDIEQHNRQAVRDQIRKDPGLLRRLGKLLSQ